MYNPDNRRHLSIEQEEFVAGWLVHCNNYQLPTTTLHVMEFIRKQFEVEVSKSWISRFMARFGFSPQLPSNARESERDPLKIHEAILFLTRIREKIAGKRLDQVVVLDKTSFYLDSRYVKQWAPVGGYCLLSFIPYRRERPRRQSNPRGPRSVVYTTLVGDGSVGPLYIEETRGAEFEGRQYIIFCLLLRLLSQLCEAPCP